MNAERLKLLFPNASPDFIERNSVCRAAQGSEPEPIVRYESVAAPTREVGDAPRHVVRITSFRRKLLDPDNLSGGVKYFLDGVRLAGFVPDDSPDKIILEVAQQKVAQIDEERTEIEVLTLRD